MKWVWLEVRGGVAVYKGVSVWVWCGWALDGRHCDMGMHEGGLAWPEGLYLYARWSDDATQRWYEVSHPLCQSPSRQVSILHSEI